MSKKLALAGLVILVVFIACMVIGLAIQIIRTPSPAVSQGPSDTEVIAAIHRFYGRPSGTYTIAVKGKAPCILPSSDNTVSEKWSVVYYQDVSPRVPMRHTMAVQKKNGSWEWAPFEGCKADLPY